MLKAYFHSLPGGSSDVFWVSQRASATWVTLLMGCCICLLVILGGLKDHIKEIQRCRRLILIACGTSYHAGVAVSSTRPVPFSSWGGAVTHSNNYFDVRFVDTGRRFMSHHIPKLLEFDQLVFTEWHVSFVPFSDTAGSGGAHRAARHGRAGQRFLGQKHSGLPRRRLLFHQPVRCGSLCHLNPIKSPPPPHPHPICVQPSCDCFCGGPFCSFS